MPVPPPVPPPKDSSTGGYLRPASSPAPLEGQALDRFFQQFVAGITGMDGDLVRPAWQAEPPVIPAAALGWAAVRVNTIPADTFPAVIHNRDGSDTLQRHEMLNINVSFYGLGTDGPADENGALLRDGLAIVQNLEPLFLAGMGLNSVGSLLTVPSLLKERWLYRVDFPFIVAREVERTYPVKNVNEAVGQIVLDGGLVLPIEVTPPPP